MPLQIGLSEGLRGHALDRFELPVEVGDVVKPAAVADLRYTLLRFDQHFASMSNPDLV